jgi:hypothetical protein
MTGDVVTKSILAAGIFAVLVASPVQAQNALRITQACMTCAAKCEKCIGRRGNLPARFASVADCKRDCARRGNPMVNATCGQFARS